MSAPSEVHGLLEHLAYEVAQGISGKTGEEFFRALARHLALALNADVVIIGELQPSGHSVRTLGIYKDGMEPDALVYNLGGTPCAQLIDNRTVSYISGLQQLFPEDPRIAEIGAEGYAGASMIGSSGTCTGLICALTRGPLQAPQIAEGLLSMFAPRASSELERQSYEKALARVNAVLESRVRELTELKTRLGTVAEVAETPQSLHDAERQHILRILTSTGWVVEGSKGAAQVLKMNASTLRSLMKRLGIRRPAASFYSTRSNE